MVRIVQSTIFKIKTVLEKDVGMYKMYREGQLKQSGEIHVGVETHEKYEISKLVQTQHE